MKMETPKMDVVRFKEADVLASSGEQKVWKATVSFAGGADENLQLDVIDPDAGANSFDFAHLSAAENAQLLANKYYYIGNDSTSLINLVDDDKDGAAGALGRFNGTYTSTDGNKYYKQ